MSESPVDAEIRALLNVEPSSDLAVRVRAAASQQPMASGWTLRVRPTLAALALAALALVILVRPVHRFSPPRVVGPAPRLAATPPAAPLSPLVNPAPLRATAPPPAAEPRRPPVLPRQRSRAAVDAEPVAAFDPNEIAAFRALMRRLAAGHAVDAAGPPAGDAIDLDPATTAIADLSIDPLVIDPLDDATQ